MHSNSVTGRIRKAMSGRRAGEAPIFTLADLESATGLDPKTLSPALRRLVKSGRVEWVAHGQYRVVKKLPSRERLRRPPNLPNSLRARLWHAMRVLRKASVGDLLALALREGDNPSSARHSANVYVRALAEAGYLTSLRRPGEKEARYALTDDVGPAPPALTRAGEIVSRRAGVRA